MPDLSLERRYAQTDHDSVAGIDEAGRGAWAGPVTAAAVTFRYGNIAEEINDSKTLSPEQRERLFESLQSSPGVDIGVGIVNADDIDRDNILQATFAAMVLACNNLSHRPDLALIDGRQLPPGLPVPAVAVVCGDARSLSIAGASIVAKVTRDRIMRRLDAEFPGYGFARHKGYGVKAHALALDRLGVCALHRKSFAPVRRRLENPARQSR